MTPSPPPPSSSPLVSLPISDSPPPSPTPVNGNKKVQSMGYVFFLSNICFLPLQHRDSRTINAKSQSEQQQDFWCVDFSNSRNGFIRRVDLIKQPISGDLMNLNWQNLHGLMVLDLSNMRLTGGIPESISSLENLRFLGLNDNNLSGNLSPKLAELANLNALYVNGNNLTGDLKFPKEFYGKMGRRFGAWNNSNLCFLIATMPANVRPFGVKVCLEALTALRPPTDSPRINPDLQPFPFSISISNG